MLHSKNKTVGKISNTALSRWVWGKRATQSLWSHVHNPPVYYIPIFRPGASLDHTELPPAGLGTPLLARKEVSHPPSWHRKQNRLLHSDLLYIPLRHQTVLTKTNGFSEIQLSFLWNKKCLNFSISSQVHVTYTVAETVNCLKSSSLLPLCEPTAF